MKRFLWFYILGVILIVGAVFGIWSLLNPIKADRPATPEEVARMISALEFVHKQVLEQGWDKGGRF